MWHRFTCVTSVPCQVTLCLNFIEESLQSKANTYAVLKQRLQPLMFNIIFPLLCNRSADPAQTKPRCLASRHTRDAHAFCNVLPAAVQQRA